MPTTEVPACVLMRKFTGKERDVESGLDDFEARHYSSALGRFMQSDEFPGGPMDLFDDQDGPASSALPYADITDPQSLNRYAYTYNNPLRYIDPDGHGVGDFLVGAMDAVVSDFTGGVRPLGQGNSDFQSGQQLGHGIAVVGGAIETAFGATTTVAGGAEALATSPAAPTGLPAVGVGVAVAGVAITAHGATVVTTAIKNMAGGAEGRRCARRDCRWPSHRQARKQKGSERG